ncbi:MAG: sigma-70 family RNA polymerase sigma factor [Actinobacteria bacterium]|nr:sigma-70 family RNA polymerase sigma factor [Actinomycetota bacterium]MBU4489519.1 sigma-70 family RNA polymerase sigma factor [Actinomycetota bacterium]MCG2794870.1 sigma-70 family RNA polymerase sigma factor [Actinomycetes bacterium]
MPEKRIKEPKGKEKGLVVIPGDGGVPDSLVQEAQGSPEALEWICDYYIPRIYNYVLKRVGRVQDAEDVTSIVFEKVLLNLGSFDGAKASFSTWIYRIATNCVTDFYRSGGRRKEIPLEEVRAGRSHLADADIERVDLSMALVELLRELPSKYQEALALRYFAGMRVQEVAEALGITEGAASKRILRGLDELKELAAAGPLGSLL